MALQSYEEYTYRAREIINNIILGIILLEDHLNLIFKHSCNNTQINIHKILHKY